MVNQVSPHLKIIEKEISCQPSVPLVLCVILKRLSFVDTDEVKETELRTKF